MGMRVPSSSAGVQGGAQAWQQRQQNFQALSQALGSGDLTAAKTAYAALTGNDANKAASNPNSPLAQLGQALQGGDLAAAQKAFSQIKSGHGHHQKTGASSANPAPAPATPPSGTTGNNVNVYV
jgi:hypothetical protein